MADRSTQEYSDLLRLAGEIVALAVALGFVWRKLWTWVVSYLSVPITLSRIQSSLEGLRNQRNRDEAKFNLLCAAFDVPMFSADSEGRIIESSPAMCDLFDAHEQSLFSHGWMSFVEEERRDAILSGLCHAVRTSSSFTASFHIYPGTSRDALLVSMTVEPWGPNEGDVAGCSGVIQALSEPRESPTTRLSSREPKRPRPGKSA